MEPVEVDVVRFPSADGTMLEADVLTPSDARGTAVICHPHPLYGGSRNDAVVATLSRAFVEQGRRVLRFDFRGTGGSEGSHDNGVAERDDLRAAIEQVDPGDGPLCIAGYSFGADIALAVVHPAARQWFVIAPPLAIVPTDELVAATDERPVTIVTGAHDQFLAADAVEQATAAWTNTTVVAVPGADHFFAGAQSTLADLASRALLD